MTQQHAGNYQMVTGNGGRENLLNIVTRSDQNDTFSNQPLQREYGAKKKFDTAGGYFEDDKKSSEGGSHQSQK